MKNAGAFRMRSSVKISQKFISYVEKHRIFELFQELSAMLLIKKPDDHLLFLKQSIYHAARRLDVPRLIILAPPDFDKMQLAKCLVTKLNIPLISLKDIIDDTESTTTAFSSRTIEKLRIVLSNYMQMNYDGWIFLDFPRNNEEARCLQRAGIIPSNVLDIIPPEETMCDSPRSKKLTDYCSSVRILRNVFSEVIKSVHVKDQSMDDIVDKCMDIVKHRQYSGRPVIMFRIILIDFPNPKRGKCLGQQIARKFSIMHIDFYDIFEIISLQNTSLGDELRKARKHRELKDLPSSLKIKVFETFLSQTNSINKGWILTGLPFTLDDLKHLDMTDTPPNRMIVIIDQTENTEEDTESDSTCRCSNAQSSSSYSKEQSVIKAILDYASATACTIPDHPEERVLREKIEYELIQPPPCVPPRRPREPAVVKPEDVEFDPDGEPDTNVFDGIRECEPILPLV